MALTNNYRKEERKRILILAGTYFQIPAINYAKQMGHYVITCDNKPENPGHKLADEYINISTTNLDGVLKVASQKKIDGILAYASDPAALTAAYVSNNLDLPGNNYECVHTLSDKGLFRKFLSDNKFPSPKYAVFKSFERVYQCLDSFDYNIFVKPVDSSGSKGVSKLSSKENLEEAFNYALQFSRKGEVIIEEEVQPKGPHIHGEAFMYNGKLKFLLLGDQYFSKTNLCAPCSTTLPSIENTDIIDSISVELVRILKLIGFNTGGLNIEIIRDRKDQIYFVEIGARNGGNLMPDLAMLASGFDLAAANVNSALKEESDFHFSNSADKFFTQVILHSHATGKYCGINIPEVFMKNVKTELMYCKKGDKVHIYRNSQDVVGVFLFSFDNKQVCNDLKRFINHNNIINLI
jgi:biotin carboxylase